MHDGVYQYPKVEEVCLTTNLCFDSSSLIKDLSRYVHEIIVFVLNGKKLVKNTKTWN